MSTSPSTAPAPPRIIMIPSVDGGVGHISRSAILAGALRRLDPSVEVRYVLDAERLRPFNVEATRQMGFEPRLMPRRSRDARDRIVRECLGDADVIVDDTTRYLVPLRRVVPHAAWVSVPMHPIGDELFLDWPYMVQMDAIIWAYSPLVEVPEELGIAGERVTVTGPFLDLGDVPDEVTARARLGLAAGERSIVYSPRGFPFGREFGHRVLAAVFGAAAALRGAGHPGLVLDLLAVSDRSDLQGVPGLPEALPDWVRVHGVLPREEVLLRMRAAAVLVAEGTSTMHEGAAMGTPLVLVPGPIRETELLATRLAEHGAAHALLGEAVGTGRLRDALAAVLDDPAGTEAMTGRARDAVTSGGGVAAAARLVLDLAERRRAARPAAWEDGWRAGAADPAPRGVAS